MPAPEKSGTTRSKRAGSTQGGGEAGVLDLCALAPAKGGVTFVKQRVVLLSPAGLQRAVQDQTARAVEGNELIKQVFLSRFPLKRFHNVVSGTPGKAAWSDRGSLSLAEVREALSDDDAAEFLAYSVGCSDYLAVPVVDKVDITRKPVVVKDKQGRERTVEQLTVNMSATLSLYRRQDAGFVLHARLAASVPATADLVSDFGTQAFSMVEAQTANALGSAGTELATSAIEVAATGHISSLPDPSCVIPKSSRESVPGLGSCPKKGLAPAWLASAAVDERFGPACKAAAAAPEDKQKAMICELRVRSFQLSRALQKGARGVEGWSLFDVLLRGSQADPEGLGMALGEAEGVRVGHAFQVRDAAGERLGFLKVTDVGPGGDAGRRRRSDLVLRAGEAPVGSRVEEYPLLGVALWGYGGGGLLGWNYGYTTVANSAAFRMPSAVGGGGIMGGYDLSEHVGWTETYLRAGASFAGGSGVNTSLTMITIDALFEKGTYLTERVSVFAGLGSSLVLSSAKLSQTPITKETKLSSTVIGPLGTAGIDVLITPEVYFRAAVVARAPLTQASWKEEEPDEEEKAAAAADPRPSPLSDWTRREDHMLSVLGTGGLAVLFLCDARARGSPSWA